MLGDIGDYLGSIFGEVGHHPLQAAGAALGVPGYDPFFGGLLNNHKGGALLSPTGNFTSSAWNEMYQDNPNSTAGLNLFHGLNSAADVIAPSVAGAYGFGGMSGDAAAGGASAPGTSTGSGLNPMQISSLAQQLLQGRQQTGTQQPPIQNTPAPVAAITPFSPLRVFPSSIPMQQLYAQGLANYGA